MKICFVGDELHRRAETSNFFVDVLRSIGDITELYADAAGPPAANDALVRRLIDASFDRYVFWRSEGIAERLLPIDPGLSFLVPMDDAVAGRSGDYWLRFVRHRFICFTRARHEQLQRLGCRSFHFQYFPEPGPEPRGAVGQDDAAAGEPLFFAPGSPDGWGSKTLAAMARGRVVVAPDLPPTNEHVAHLCSGLLYDPQTADAARLRRLDPDVLARIGRAARRKVVEGRSLWLKDVDRLRSIIADDGVRWSTTDYSGHFARIIRRAAHERSLDAR